MNNDLISRKWLTDAIRNRRTYLSYEDAKDVIDLIDNAPTVEPLERIGSICEENCGYRPQGEWIKITKNGTIPVEYICSVCGRKIFDNYELSVPQSVYYPFCHCGADMRGVKNG